MSHEIRTPMNVIIGFSEVLAEEELTDEQKRHVNIIENSAQHLLQLINDILDLSKIDVEKLKAQITDCLLSELLGGIESLMRPAARQLIQATALPKSSAKKPFKPSPDALKQATCFTARVFAA